MPTVARVLRDMENFAMMKLYAHSHKYIHIYVFTLNVCATFSVLQVILLYVDKEKNLSIFNAIGVIAPTERQKINDERNNDLQIYMDETCIIGI